MLDSRRRGGRSVGGTDFLIFNQQFNTRIKAGLPILKALGLLAEGHLTRRLFGAVQGRIAALPVPAGQLGLWQQRTQATRM